MKKILSTIAIAASAVLVTGSYVHAEELAPVDGVGLFEMADSDESGDISLEEFTVIMKEKGREEYRISKFFSLKDANSDGVLSREECMNKPGKKKDVAEGAVEENH